MRKNGFLTRCAAKALVVAVAAGGGMLIGGVANAAAPATGSTTLGPSASPEACVADGSNSPVAGPTNTTLTVAPSGSVPADLPVTLIAIVTPCAAQGTVQFKDGDTNIGDPVPVIRGTGWTITPTSTTGTRTMQNVAFAITSSLATGTHALTAHFIPADRTAFEPSTSPAVQLTISPPILAGLPFSHLLGGLPGGAPGFDPAQLIPQILGGLPGGTPSLDPTQLIPRILEGLPGATPPTTPTPLLPHILGGLPGGADDIDPAKLVQSILGGLSF